MQLHFLAIALLFTGLQCYAADSVRITYDPGYPPPGVSTERAVVLVNRTFTWPGSDAEIDKYFNAVAEIVAILEKTNCPPAMHSPTVSVQIDLGDRSLSRECGLSATGVSTSIGASAGELANKQALERLLKLTIERSNALLRQ